MRFPRMTTRRWMAGVAFVAVVFAVAFEAERLHRISRRRLQIATRHADFEKTLRGLAANWEAQAKKHRHDADLLRRHGIPDDSDPVFHRVARYLGDDYYRENAEAEEKLAKTLHAGARTSTRQADHSAALARNYRLAAWLPWLAVPPAPPVPE
jgi:hypothetical protein